MEGLIFGILRYRSGTSGLFTGESWLIWESWHNVLSYHQVTTYSSRMRYVFCAHVKRLLLFLQGAERKNKDESKSAEKRIQKWVKQNTSACAGECLSGNFFSMPVLCKTLIATLLTMCQKFLLYSN